MTGKQLNAAADILFRTFQKFQKLARTQPELAPQVKELETMWLGMHRAANTQLLVEGERKDKGQVLWTVFQPIMLGKDEGVYCGGVREIVRTPWRLLTTYHWRNSRAAAADGRPSKPTQANWDLKSAMLPQ